MNVPVIVRRSQLKATVGLSPSTVDRLEAKGLFPKRKRYGIGVTGWSGSEVEAWGREAGVVL